MDIIGLDNNKYKLSLAGYKPKFDDDRPRSKYHKAARKLLNEMFGFDPILEEVFLPGSYGLFADFYLPRRNMMVEVHGEQHYKFVRMFHKDRYDFNDQIKRDKNKFQWCEQNNIRYVVLPFNEFSEDFNEWKRRIGVGLGD